MFMSNIPQIAYYPTTTMPNGGIMPVGMIPNMGMPGVLSPAMTGNMNPNMQNMPYGFQ